MIDLHIHSNCSDGSDEVIEILKKAEKIGLECISITDHDHCKGYEELEKEALQEYYTGKLITGVELQAYLSGFSIELLGYGVDPKKIKEEVKKLYLPFEIINQKELERLYNRCVELGIIFQSKVLEEYSQSRMLLCNPIPSSRDDKRSTK